MVEQLKHFRISELEERVEFKRWGSGPTDPGEEYYIGPGPTIEF